MEERNIEVKEKGSASQKLGREAAEEILSGRSKLIVAKGKVWRSFSKSELAGSDAVDAMLGPTGNLRAPTLKVGKTIVVGFHAEPYSEMFGE